MKLKVVKLMLFNLRLAHHAVSLLLHLLVVEAKESPRLFQTHRQCLVGVVDACFF